MTRVHGYDLAPNHGACCELTDGVLTGFWFMSDSAAITKLGEKHSIRLKLPPKTQVPDRLQRMMLRLSFWERFTWNLVTKRRPEYVGIEDYALEGGSRGAHYKGEVGGVVRIVHWIHDVPMRFHDPRSVKMFAAHDGGAGKTAMVEAVAKRWHDFRHLTPPLKPTAKPTASPNTDTTEDCADALAVAQLVWTEVQIRSGAKHTRDLLHPKERQVFNRCTTAYPQNILDRQWIRRASEDD